VSSVSVTAQVGAGAGQTSDDIAREIVRVQGEADAAALAWGQLDADATQLADDVTAAQADVAQATATYSAMTQTLANLAVDRLTSGSDTGFVLLSQDATDQLQRDALAEYAVGAGNVSLDTLEQVQKDLAARQQHLATLQQRNTVAQNRLAANKAQLDARIVQLTALEGQLKDAEVEKAYKAQLAQLRAKEQAAADKQAAAVGVGSTGSGTPLVQADPSAAPVSPLAVPTSTVTAVDGTGKTFVPSPAVVVGGNWVCPVAGPNAFSDTFGAPRPNGRHHEGVDMISPYGTPLVAIVAGFAQFKPDPLGGNSISFKGDDGNGYYYAHLSAYAGSSRHVEQGEVIGYVGHTGDTTVNHLHFEIHPGMGPAVDPTPTVRAHC